MGNGGAELSSRDRMFVSKYEAGYDRLDSTYQLLVDTLIWAYNWRMY